MISALFKMLKKRLSYSPKVTQQTIRAINPMEVEGSWDCGVGAGGFQHLRWQHLPWRMSHVVLQYMFFALILEMHGKNCTHGINSRQLCTCLNVSQIYLDRNNGKRINGKPRCAYMTSNQKSTCERNVHILWNSGSKQIFQTTCVMKCDVQAWVLEPKKDIHGRSLKSGWSLEFS